MQRADGMKNRRRILEIAGEQLLAGRDFTMADLARGSGLTRATVYRHFADRSEVLNAIAHDVAEATVPALLDALRPLPFGAALDRLAHDVVETSHTYRHVIAAHSRSVDEIARHIVPDEPIAVFLAERRASDEFASPLSDGWLAASIRALCLVAADDPRNAKVVASDLAHSFKKLLGCEETAST